MKRTRKYECDIGRACWWLHSFLPFYFRDYAFSISRIRLSRSLEQNSGAANSQLRLSDSRTRKEHATARHYYEDMDNLVYDISFFLCLFFL